MTTFQLGAAGDLPIVLRLNPHDLGDQSRMTPEQVAPFYHPGGSTLTTRALTCPGLTEAYAALAEQLRPAAEG